MITKIYTIPNCPKCKIAKVKFPNAKFIDFQVLDRKFVDILLEKCKIAGALLAPILLDENNNIITHKKAGLK